MRRLRRFLHVAGIVLLLVVGVKLVSLPLVQGWGEQAWRDGEFRASEERWEPLARSGNVASPDVAHMNVGVAQYRTGRYVAARASFERALAAAPETRRCAARRNLVLTLEARGGTLGSASEDLAQERVLRRALRLIDDAPGCLAEDAPDRESAEELRAARQRLRAASALGARPSDNGRSPAARPGGERNPYGEPAPEATQRLQDLQRQAAQYRARATQLARNGSSRPTARDEPRW